MTKNSPICALTALLTLLALSGCASQTTCMRPPLHDSPAPPPMIFSRCLNEILDYGRGKGLISQTCSDFLHPKPMK